MSTEFTVTLRPNQSTTCPHCGGELSAATPVMSGEEPEELRGRSAFLVATAMATDPRPKCPHCYGRFIVDLKF